MKLDHLSRNLTALHYSDGAVLFISPFDYVHSFFNHRRFDAVLSCNVFYRREFIKDFAKDNFNAHSHIEIEIKKGYHY